MQHGTSRTYQYHPEAAYLNRPVIGLPFANRSRLSSPMSIDGRPSTAHSASNWPTIGPYLKPSPL
jgi:hypothetical protein